MHTAAFAFFVGAFLVLYVLILYPLLLAARRSQNAPKCREPHLWRTVSVILPVRNGGRWLRQKLESIFSLDYPAELLQVIVISDNSTDNTETIAASNPRVQLFRNPHSGKAAAINEGLHHATGEILFFTDVRQPLASKALKHLVACFEDPAVGVATGELIIRSGDTNQEQDIGLYWRFEKWIRKQHSAIDSVLGATGAIYAMRRKVVAPVPPGTLLDDMYLPLNAFLQGYRIIFVPEAQAWDDPTILATEFRRKVRTQAGVYQLLGLRPQLLGPRNRMWIHFASHKLGRLLLPFALLTVFVSSWFLPDPFGTLAGLAQLAFYALAGLDLVIPENSPVKRLTSIVRTFVVLMIAAFVAASILFRPSESFWSTPTKK
jgi:cellulose synthase/poly-beta-1,6-N-acetylglucosamine synthase-like glycosyltransferase